MVTGYVFVGIGGYFLIKFNSNVAVIIFDLGLLTLGLVWLLVCMLLKRRVQRSNNQ